jgi:hypothetical protein
VGVRVGTRSLLLAHLHFLGSLPISACSCSLRGVAGSERTLVGSHFCHSDGRTDTLRKGTGALLVGPRCLSSRIALALTPPCLCSLRYEHNHYHYHKQTTHMITNIHTYTHTHTHTYTQAYTHPHTDTLTHTHTTTQNAMLTHEHLHTCSLRAGVLSHVLASSSSCRQHMKPFHVCRENLLLSR